jgi:hypothetical protein
VAAAVAASGAVPEPLAPPEEEGLGTLVLVLVLGVPGAMLLLAMLPEHAVRAAGSAGRLVAHSRVLLAAVAFAIWIGVVISFVLGGSA